MNEKDLRDCFAMFAMLGFVIADGGEIAEGTAISSYELADMMLKARNPEPEEGIVAIKKRVRKPK